MYHAVPLPCRDTLIHTCRVAGKIQTAIRETPHVSRKKANLGRSMLIHTYHAVPLPCCAMALTSRFQGGLG